VVSPEHEEVIRLARPDITEADIEAVSEVLRSGQLVQGAKVREFELAISEYTDGGEVVAVANGTAALHLALLSLGIGPGKKVGVPVFSWPATANAVILSGATPVFVDIESETMGMDPEGLDSTLRRIGSLDAVMPVHAFGQMARIDEIADIASSNGIPLIEDAACALGARWDRKPAGSWGAIGCFSFHPRKAATTGEGGAIRTSDREIARSVRILRNHGLNPDAPKADFIDAGFNLRLTEFQAALGLSQLSRYPKLIAERRDRAHRYNALLAEVPATLPVAENTDCHIYQSYVIQLDPGLAHVRDEILGSLRVDGVEASIGTHHIPTTSYFRKRFGYKGGDFPVGERVAASAIALPLHSYLTPKEQQHVASSLVRAIDRYRD
jgi:perosamine synthetase